MNALNLQHLEYSIPGNRMNGTATSKNKTTKKLSKNGKILASQRTYEYFEKLSSFEIDKLLKLYQPDFDMFQYATDGFV